MEGYSFREEAKAVDLRKIFSSIRSLDQVNVEPHIAILNPKVLLNVPPEQLVPITFVSLSEWEQVPTIVDNHNVLSSADSPARLSNGAPAPKRETYYVRMKELQLDNEDAYGAMERHPGDRKKSMKIMHFRSFFEQLKLVGTYWDTSLDNDLAENSDSSIRHRTKDSGAMDVDRNDKVSTTISSQTRPPTERLQPQGLHKPYKAACTVKEKVNDTIPHEHKPDACGQVASQASPQQGSQQTFLGTVSSHYDAARLYNEPPSHISLEQSDSFIHHGKPAIDTENLIDMSAIRDVANEKLATLLSPLSQIAKVEYEKKTAAEPNAAMSTANEITGNNRNKATYTGRRNSTGTKMPETYRTTLVRTFLEPIMWAFGCHAELRNGKSRLQVENLLISTRPTMIVYRIPTDRARAKSGMLEGPVMGVSCRSEISAQRTNSAEVALKRELDRLDVIYREGDLNEEQYKTKKRDIQKKRNDIAARDLMREIGVMLQIAQDRSREGREEVIPGKGKWWVEKPRYWGGKERGEMGEGQNQKERIQNELRKTKQELTSISEEVIYRRNIEETLVEKKENDGTNRKKNVREDINREEQGNSRTEERPKNDDTSQKIHVREDIQMEEQGNGKMNQTKKRKAEVEGQASQQACDELQRDGDGGRGMSKEHNFSNHSDKGYRSSTPAQNPQNNESAFGLRPSIEKPAAPDPVAKNKKKNLEKWAKLEPPSPRWESRVSYIRIGKAPQQEEEVIYLISCVYHHISILRMRVRPEYLAWVERGGGETEDDWNELSIARSQWYDLLQPQDRVEAFKCLWGTFSWMMRDVREEK